ncbi:MAG: hypothetical protein WA093_03255 [Minisyncoccales bacterium]
MDAKKIIGWIVVIVGLVIIGQAVNSSYQFFTAKADFPAIFKIAPSQTPAPQVSQSGALSQVDIQVQMQQATNQAIGNMVPADAINKLLNAIAWSMFATFLVYSGAKIAEIGVKLTA